MLDLPITNGPNLEGSYVTQILRGESSIPSNLKERYFDFCGSSITSEERFRSFSNDSLIFLRVS